MDIRLVIFFLNLLIIWLSLYEDQHLSRIFHCNLLVVAKVQVAHEEGNCQRATAAAEANLEISLTTTLPLPLAQTHH